MALSRHLADSRSSRGDRICRSISLSRIFILDEAKSRPKVSFPFFSLVYILSLVFFSHRNIDASKITKSNHATRKICCSSCLTFSYQWCHIINDRANSLRHLMWIRIVHKCIMFLRFKPEAGYAGSDVRWGWVRMIGESTAWRRGSRTIGRRSVPVQWIGGSHGRLSWCNWLFYWSRFLSSIHIASLSHHVSFVSSKFCSSVLKPNLY